MSSAPLEKVALTPAEFAALFGKSQTWGYRQLYAGKVKALTGYGRTLIPISEVERVLKEAGRYLGAKEKTAKAEAEIQKKKDKAKPVNRWKKMLSQRKQKPASNLTKSGSKKISAARRSALKKLDRSGK